MQYKIVKWKNYGFINPKLDSDSGLAITLDKCLSYEKKGIEFMPNKAWGVVHLFSKKKSMFAWGLLKMVEKVMDKYCAIHQHTFTIEYSPPIKEMIDMPKLRPYQLDAVNALLRNGGGILRIPTAGGKTITIIEYLKLMNRRTLIICTTLDICRQWREYNLSNMTVSTYQNPELKKKEIMESYEIIVFDESHHASSKTIFGHAQRTNTNAILIGVSATGRDDGEDMRVHAALGPIVYEISRKQLITEGYLANAEIIYLKPTFNIDGKYMNYQEVYNLAIVNNDYRNMLIQSTAIKEARNDRQVLVLVSTIKHGEIILDLLAPFRNELKIIFMNGKSKDRDQDMTGYNIIIATSIYDEGYNLPSLDTLILGGAGRSAVKVTQRVGRVLRQKHDGRIAKVYDFNDSAVKYLKKQYQERRKLLEQEFEVIERLL